MSIPLYETQINKSIVEVIKKRVIVREVLLVRRKYKDTFLTKNGENEDPENSIWRTIGSVLYIKINEKYTCHLSYQKRWVFLQKNVIALV